MTSTGPRCSVVIVTWNRLGDLKRAVASVLAQTIASSIEVLIVDNGSTDGTVEWLKDEAPDTVRALLFDTNQGASHGRNAGILASRAPHVCFLDSDAEILSPDAIERCLGHLAEGGRVRAVTGHIWLDREMTAPFSKGVYMTPEGHFCRARSRRDTEDPHAISTCFSVWEKGLLEELGGFDPWFFWGVEDLDIALRAYHRSLRGESRGASRFAVLEGVHVLHDMSHGGRHYRPDDFSTVFHRIERQRLYLMLSCGGLAGFFGAWARSFRNRGRIVTEAWEQPLTRGQWLWLLVLYPVNRLIRLPLDIRHTAADHLRRAPRPRGLARERGVPAGR